MPGLLEPSATTPSPVADHRAAGSGAGGRFSHGWKLLICVSAELAGRGLHAERPAAFRVTVTSQLLVTSPAGQRGPQGRGGCTSTRCCLLSLHLCLPKSWQLRQRGF